MCNVAVNTCIYCVFWDITHESPSRSLTCRQGWETILHPSFQKPPSIFTDVIIYSKFNINWLRGFGSGKGRISPFCTGSKVAINVMHYHAAGEQHKSEKRWGLSFLAHPVFNIACYGNRTITMSIAFVIVLSVLHQDIERFIIRIKNGLFQCKYIHVRYRFCNNTVVHVVILFGHLK